MISSIIMNFWNQKDHHYYYQKPIWINENFCQKCAALVNRNDVILQYDNAKAHLTSPRNIKIVRVVFPHRPYSPNVAHTDFK